MTPLRCAAERPAARVLTPSGLAVRRDATWPNGCESWTIVSPGPWSRASFTVRPGEDVTRQARATARRFAAPRECLVP